jgi:hypothetical protein
MRASFGWASLNKNASFVIKVLDAEFIIIIGDKKKLTGHFNAAFEKAPTLFSAPCFCVQPKSWVTDFLPVLWWPGCPGWPDWTKFRPIGDFLIWAVTWKFRKCHTFGDTLWNSSVKFLHMCILTKMGCAIFGWFFHELIWSPCWWPTHAQEAGRRPKCVAAETKSFLLSCESRGHLSFCTYKKPEHNVSKIFIAKFASFWSQSYDIVLQRQRCKNLQRN